MLYNRLLRQIESKTHALDMAALWKYICHAEQRGTHTFAFFQCIGMIAWLIAALAAPSQHALHLNSIIGYSMGMTAILLLTILRNPLWIRVALKFVFYGFLTQALRSLILTSDNGLFWALSVCALIVVATSPMFHDPFSFSTCAGIVIITLLGPYSGVFLNSSELNWFICFVGSVLIFGLSVNVMFFRQGFRIYATNRKLLEMAYTDSLTGINNRRSFLECVDELMKDGQKNRNLFLFLIDVDNFKSINDAYGHEKGDEVLIEIAARLNKAASPMRCGRLGGEEFGAVVCGSSQQAGALAGEINRSISAVAISGLRVTVSIGVAELYGEMSMSELLAEADRQMYVAKRAGKNCYSLADQVAGVDDPAAPFLDDALGVAASATLKS
ncbi:GGDEF domain-containing protein [Herbaspirillum huttiense]|uniref:diguanylate cyclase n=2 Tax=Herbaspirillum huttiense TaxID=863372 RepID=A0AAJ2HD42_9BURK|nr:GGDEF domain-containing protein [Herbaspirillum huttiense]MDR9839144.1 GGDEF domain-containing protein [Herbaspirillum huttiense]